MTFRQQGNTIIGQYPEREIVADYLDKGPDRLTISAIKKKYNIARTSCLYDLLARHGIVLGHRNWVKRALRTIKRTS